MVVVGFSAMWTPEIPSPHTIDQFEPYICQSENDDASNCRCNGRIYVHYEDEIMNVDHFTSSPARLDPGVERRVDDFRSACAILRYYGYKHNSK